MKRENPVWRWAAPTVPLRPGSLIKASPCHKVAPLAQAPNASLWFLHLPLRPVAVLSGRFAGKRGSTKGSPRNYVFTVRLLILWTYLLACICLGVSFFCFIFILIYLVYSSTRLSLWLCVFILFCFLFPFYLSLLRPRGFTALHFPLVYKTFLFFSILFSVIQIIF